MSQPSVPSKMADFYVLPISLPPPKSFPVPTTHFLYLRPDEPKVAVAVTPRTLFIVNIPFDTTETHLKWLFSAQLDLPAGRIEEIEYGEQPAKTRPQGPQISTLPSRKKNTKRKRESEAVDDTTPELRDQWPTTWDRELHAMGSTVRVVFIDKKSMEAAVKASRKVVKSGKKIVWGQGIEDKVAALGSKRYSEHQKLTYPPQAELLKSVNDYMASFAAQEAAKSKALSRQRAEPDADGFVTVTRGGRVGAARQEEASEMLERQKEKQQGFDDFYRFQSREKRKDKANELLKKFEEDKEKVRRMKEQRKRFRPE